MNFLSMMAGWLRRRDGSIAVEFALISIPFIYTTIAIMELSFYFAATNMLEGGVSAAARQIRTGQVQASVDVTPEEAFRANLCDQLYVLVKCDDVQIEVVAMPDDEFSSVDDYQPQYDDDGNFVPRDFDAGGSGDVVMIRAYYRYQLLTPLFAQIFSNEPDETVVMLSTVIIQSEPYEFD